MSDHAFLSPSFAHIGYKCAAAALRSFQVKQRMELLREIATEYYGLKKPAEVLKLEAILKDDNTMAVEGTALHLIFEDAMNDVKLDKRQIITKIHKHIDITKGTKTDAYIHSRFYQIINDQREFIKKCDWFAIEKKITVTGLPQYGTVDLVAGDLKDRVLYIKDLKTGYNAVESKDNEQLMTYAVGALDEVDEEGSGWDKYKYVEMQILGVRWDAKPWRISVDKIRKFKNEIMLPAFMNAYSINPNATTGDHCRYCAGKIHCKPWLDKFNTMIPPLVNNVFDDDEILNLNTDELVELWKLCKQAETLMKKQLSPEIMQRFQGFDEPKGVKLVSGGQVEKFNLPESEVVEKLKSKVKSKSELYNQQLMSPKQIKAALNLPDDALNEFVTKETKKPYLR